jgi:hypothetical protein
VDEAPALAARQHPGGERGCKSGSQHRGLAAARRADGGEQRRADKPRHQLGDEALAPEVVARVVRVEARQALERTDVDGRLALAGLRGVEAGQLLEELHVGHVGLELRFRVAEHATARGGPVRRVGEPPAGVGTGPLADEPMDPARKSFARLEYRL